jgi:Ni2+-binding GTPase involved in maturation of urease and hydrogenase
MSFFKTFGPINSVKDLLLINKTAGAALINFHQEVLREESELSVGQREFIAAYVSGLNSCQYCHEFIQ